jgi:hypothetical protein
VSGVAPGLRAVAVVGLPCWSVLDTGERARRAGLASGKQDYAHLSAFNSCEKRRS